MSKILVLDDEPLIAMMIVDWLEELGLEVMGPAHSIKQAQALLENGYPDAAILDVTLGSETSYPVAELLAQRNVPFVFATGHGTAAVAPQFQHIQSLAKPFDFDVIRQVMANLLQRPLS
jgi:DNA-binding NtrC family response regulator